MPGVFFDEALPNFLAILVDKRGTNFAESGVFVRDAFSRLSFFSSVERPVDSEAEELEAQVRSAVKEYARAERLIVYSDAPGAADILRSAERIPQKIGEIFCRLIDRRIVGSGWLANPSPNLSVPPRIVFATLKGGVGRSTALAVTAADLARRNRNVLAVDLDLEAPGLGNLMLADDRIPDFGVVDYLVESSLIAIQNEFLGSFVGTSSLTVPGGGRVDVMPAMGRKASDFPENALSKLSRAMIEDVNDEGVVSVGEKISRMISSIVKSSDYDVVLIDSRAGLAELAAPAVIGLGATVLLFGTAQKQTMEGYKALFAALQLLAQRDRFAGRAAEWRTALRPVYAKASLDADVEQRFLDDIYELYSDHLYDAEVAGTGDEDALRFTRDDKSAPHWPLIIPFSQNFVDFDPTRIPGQLSESFYEQAYRPFLDAVDCIIAANKISV